MYQELWDENLDCIKAPMLYSGYEDILIPTGDKIMAAVKDSGSLEGITDMIDEIHQKFLKGGEKAIEIGRFEKNFTHEETVQLFAHILQSKGESDLSLVSDGIVKDGVSNNSGVHLKFFEGPLLEEMLTCTIPGSGILESAVQLTLTGAQIKDLIENGKHMAMYEGETKGRSVESEGNATAETTFDYYWSGVEVERKKGKVVSITLEGGTKMEENRTYTVTFAPGDYTDRIAEAGKPVEFGYAVKDALREYVEKNSPVSPAQIQR